MIFWFSGTGNSHYAARVLHRTLGGELVSVNEKLRVGERAQFPCGEPLIFVVPTYAWRMPRAVEQWIREGEHTGANPVWFVLTCGLSAGDASRYAAQLCSETGLSFRGLAEVVMPENYLAMFPVPDEAMSLRLLQEALPRLNKFAACIHRGEALPAIRAGLLRRLSSSVLNPGFYRTCISAKAFRTTDGCTGCGQCVRSCPMNNVSLGEDQKPRWGDKCTHCMACIAGCPAEAVEYGKRSVGKRRYWLTRGPDESN